MAEATSRSGERRDEGRQWLRRCSLLVGPKEEGALELGELRVAFTVKVSEQETPNSASIRVYNLSEATAGRIRKEFTRVILQAGYQGNCSVIFDGNITKVALGQEGGPGAGKNGGEGEGLDTCLEISAGDGDRAYNYALVNTSLAAGSTPDDHVRACMKAFSAKGIEPGYIPLLPGQKLPRGKVMYGMARAIHARHREAHRHGVELPEGQDADGARQRLPPPARPWCFPPEPGSSARPRPTTRASRSSACSTPACASAGASGSTTRAGPGSRPGRGGSRGTSTTASTASFR